MSNKGPGGPGSLGRSGQALEIVRDVVATDNGPYLCGRSRPCYLFPGCGLSGNGITLGRDHGSEKDPSFLRELKYPPMGRDAKAPDYAGSRRGAERRADKPSQPLPIANYYFFVTLKVQVPPESVPLPSIFFPKFDIVPLAVEEYP